MVSWRDIEPGDMFIYVDPNVNKNIFVVISIEHTPIMKVGWYIVFPSGQGLISQHTTITTTDALISKHFHIIKP